MHKVESKCILTVVRQQYYKNSCTTFTLIYSIGKLYYFDKRVYGREVFLKLASTADPLQSLTNSAEYLPKFITNYGPLRHNLWQHSTCRI